MRIIEVTIIRTFQNENFGDIFCRLRHTVVNSQSLSGDPMRLIPGLAAYARHPCA